jgi:secondary thiamine-phosphate synthase enzyme
MASRTEYLWFETPEPRAFLNITERVRAIVRSSGVTEGLVLVSAMHITAAVWVNDDERGLLEDIEAWADRLAPPADYHHHRTGESNGDAHLKNLLLGHQVLLPVTRGDLDLGPWEQVFYGEFDGQRRKRVVVKVLGDGAPTRPGSGRSRGRPGAPPGRRAGGPSGRRAAPSGRSPSPSPSRRRPGRAAGCTPAARGRR